MIECPPWQGQHMAGKGLSVLMIKTISAIDGPGHQFRRQEEPALDKLVAKPMPLHLDCPSSLYYKTS